MDVEGQVYLQKHKTLIATLWNVIMLQERFLKYFQISNFSKGNLTSDIKFAIMNKQNKNLFSLLKSLKTSEGVSATAFLTI